MFLIPSSKLKDSIGSLCHMKKQVCGVLYIKALKYAFKGVIFDQNYWGMQWHAIFNPHFSVPVNFVPSVHLHVFSFAQFGFNEHQSFLFDFVQHYYCFIIIIIIIIIVSWYSLKAIWESTRLSRHFSMINCFYIIQLWVNDTRV